MRKLTSILLLICGTPLGAAETWRWVDANGVTHYSDRPAPGAERITVNAPRPGSVVQPAPATSTTTALPPDRAAVPYTRCAITSPGNDEVFNAVNAVSASLALEPALQDNHHVQVMLNGRAVANWPEGALNYTLTDLYRGSYSLFARIVDLDGKMVCSGAPVTFHVRQPSLLSPARAPVPRRP
jgi:hypothetical protein